MTAARRLLQHADRVLAGRTVSAALGETKEVIGPPVLPYGEDQAQAALDKLRDGWTAPTPEEWIALRLVIQLLRPAVFTRHGGKLDPLPIYGGRDLGLAESWPTAQGWSTRLVGHVGRIDNAARQHVGTGFLIADDLVVTNRHVVDDLTFGTGQLPSGAATIHFGRERDTPNREGPADIVHVVAVHERLDVALVRIGAPRPGHLALASAPVAADDLVVAVGYPGRTEPEPVHAQVFMRTYGVRRASPGLVRDAGPDVVEHDCSTCGGSSGSPLLALHTGDVVGVHCGGQSGYANDAVPVAHVATLLDAIGARR